MMAQAKSACIYEFGEVFAIAKVKLLCSEVRADGTSEVKLAHFAVGETSLSAG